MSTSTTPTREELVARAAALVPQLKANAEEAEKERRVGEESIAALREAGLFRLAVPQRFGGYECDVATQMAVLRELAHGDGSPAWAVALYSADAWLVGRFNDQAQQEVWATGPDTLISGATGSIGTATKVEGGYLLSGSFANSSGSHYAQWVVVGAMTTTESGDILGGLAVVPTSELTLKETWFVAGMSGSGSNTWVGEDVFVPDYRIDFDSGTSGDLHRWRTTPHTDEALYATAFVPTGSALVAGPILGMAEAALEYVLQKAPTKGISDTLYRSHVDAPTAQIGIGRAAAVIRNAARVAEAGAADIWRYAERGEEMPPVERAALRLDFAWVGKSLREAIDGLVSVSGAGSFAQVNVLQRILRNVMVATRHSYLNYEIAEEIYGKQLLGNEQPVAGVL
ncbi:acyl-CoA dehydrogenase family protein [Microbacterium sp. X-17]|uniref:acyl-CoA dehydrogenase family protein n=1 Tax=Microbacterium sp. X-17 TaxID=3144404 RepID=UPI0031F50988